MNTMEEFEYEIWMEGYSITGNSQRATYIGKSNGKDFKEACQNFRDKRTGEKLKLDEHYSYPSMWACRLFDNEKDARVSFG